MMGGFFHVAFTDDHFGTSIPGAGAVHPIKTFRNLADASNFNKLQFKNI
jgi:hypothetical protein